MPDLPTKSRSVTQAWGPFLLSFFVSICALMVTKQIASASPDVLSKGGYRFPAIKIRYTQYKKHWRLYLREFQFTSIVGKRPFMMLYYSPGHGPSEVELVAFDKVCRVLAPKLDCFAIAPVRRFRDIRSISRRLKALKLSIRVLLDDKRLLSYVTLTRRLPSYSGVTKTGFLRFVNGSALTERVTPKWTVLSVMKQLARGLEIPFTRAPGYRPNTFSLLGKKAKPLGRATWLKGSSFSWSTIRNKASKRPVLFVFWSVSCPHCRRLLPLLDKALENHPSLYVVAFVRGDDKHAQKQIKQFVRKHKLQMNVALTYKGSIFDNYRALLMPTLLLFDQKDVLRSVLLGVRKRVDMALSGMMKAYKKAK